METQAAIGTALMIVDVQDVDEGDDDSVAQLFELPLLPLVNGCVGALMKGSTDPLVAAGTAVYWASALEQELLATQAGRLLNYDVVGKDLANRCQIACGLSWYCKACWHTQGFLKLVPQLSGSRLQDA